MRVCFENNNDEEKNVPHLVPRAHIRGQLVLEVGPLDAGAGAVLDVAGHVVTPLLEEGGELVFDFCVPYLRPLH